MEDIIDQVKAVIAVLLHQEPFAGSLAMKCQIRIDEDMNYPMATDGKRTIYVNPHWWRRASKDERKFAVAHEVLHLALLSHARRGDRDPMMWNVATDCVINNLLEESRLRIPKGAITPGLISDITKVPVDQIRKMTAEQIYTLLASHATKKLMQGCGYGHKESDEEEGQGGVGDEGDVEEFWKRAIAEAVNYAKSIGRIPAGIEIILEILKPKVSWQTLFKQAIVQGPGLQVLTTWRRPHRKLPQNAPGYQRLTVSNIWCCVDVSGSMVGERLNQVMSEVFAIAKSLNAKVHIIAWDVDAYPTTLSEVRQKMSVRGGGGTEIKKALELLEKKFQSNDIVVILTDGQIFDIEDPEIQAKLERLARRSASAVFATTFSTPSLPHGWRTVVIS